MQANKTPEDSLLVPPCIACSPGEATPEGLFWAAKVKTLKAVTKGLMLKCDYVQSE